MVNPLKTAKPIRVDKGDAISIGGGVETRARKAFDEDRYRRVVAEVEQQREKNRQRTLRDR